MENILIISAHPDDDILGCGGLIAKYCETKRIRVIFIAEGSSCRFPEDEINSEASVAAIKHRNQCGENALKSLGIVDYKFYNLPCGRLDSVPIININKIIEAEIRDFKPDTVFTHHAEDANNDHRIVYRATTMATRPVMNSTVKEVYSYEILSSTEWNFETSFAPNYFEELTEGQVNSKWESLKQYETEILDFPFPRSKEGIFTLSKFRGMQSGLKFAEAYRLIRKVNK